jgi:hypothetical protein
LNPEEQSSLVSTLIIGGVIALIEPELLVGMAIGVAAVAAPKLFPALATALRPLIKTTVSAGYSVVTTAREWTAEAGEQLQDLIAEAQAERTAPAAHDGPSAAKKRSA